LPAQLKPPSRRSAGFCPAQFLPESKAPHASQNIFLRQAIAEYQLRLTPRAIAQKENNGGADVRESQQRDGRSRRLFILISRLVN